MARDAASRRCSVRGRLSEPTTARHFAERSKAEFVAKCGLGRACVTAVEESAYWLELLVVAGIVPAAKLDQLRKER